MVIESVMYFALGALAAGLVALLILPAIWGRAVRLTRKRIEAATPMSMAEFRADKDQLRAEFALATRRLEKTIDVLRARLAEKLGEVSEKQSHFAAIQNERDEHQTIVRELQEREEELRQRILDLERDISDVTQRLRMRDREYAHKLNELTTARTAMRSAFPAANDTGADKLSGDYDQDMDALLTAVAIERKRVAFLEEQGRNLIAYLESTGRKTVDGTAAAAELRKALATKEDAAVAATSDLIVAEASIASAEIRLNALLEETGSDDQPYYAEREQLLAERQSLEAEVGALREKVVNVEAGITADWDTDRASLTDMRERLNDIASEVSRLVYAVDAKPSEESLFDRVQKFAADGAAAEEVPVRSALPALPYVNGKPGKVGKAGPVADRLAALHDVQTRN
jgi:chromosome segregation ATPase